MRIAYLGKTQLSDVDISYLHEAQRLMDITYYIEISPRYLHGAAIDIKKIYPKSGIFKAVDVYPEFDKFSRLLDLDKVYVINTCGGRTWAIKSFWTNVLLLFKLVKGKYNIIHVTWPFNLYELVLCFLRKKMILTVHDPFVHTGGGGLVPRMRRFLTFNMIENFILLNKAQTEQFIRQHKLDPNQVINSRLSCYTYLKELAFDRVNNLGEYLLFFGKISKYKGLDYLLPAMKKVHMQYPEIKLVVAGSGEFPFDVSEYKKLDYIEFRNRFIRDEELAQLIYYSKFVICPYTDATQSGVIMSAFAFCKPVIATKVGGLPEMLKDGLLGKLIKEKDSDSISSAILEVLSNEDVLNEYSGNIKDDYIDGADSWRTIASELFREFQRRFM